MGSSQKISSDMVLLPLVWGHRTKTREFGDRVISYLGETSWSAGCSVGPRGAWDVSDEKPQRKSPEPVSFIKSDKLFLTIALFLLFYNAVIWNSAPLFRNHKQVMNERSIPFFHFTLFYLFFLHIHMLDALWCHYIIFRIVVGLLKLNKCASLIKIDCMISVRKIFRSPPVFSRTFVQ